MEKKTMSLKTRKSVACNKSQAKKARTVLKKQCLKLLKPNILTSYLHYMDINSYMDYLEKYYGNFVKVHTIGYSHEERELRAISIDWCCEQNLSSTVEDRKNLSLRAGLPSSCIHKIPAEHKQRNIVLIEAGTHAREWMGICVALCCIQQLIEKNIRNRDILQKLRFIIVPLTNPDGYEYSHDQNRHWRKNRRPLRNSRFIGTDCNRNYDFHWNGGNSRCSHSTFKGECPFSEPETCALRNLLHALSPQLLLVISLHSYSQSIMYPWGYTDDLPDGWEHLQTVATMGRNAMRAYNGRHYRTGSIAGLTKRKFTGSIVDYAFGVVKAPLVFVIELPSSQLGFQPPSHTISGIAIESWLGIREMCKCAYNLIPKLSAEHLLQTTNLQNNRELQKYDLPKIVSMCLDSAVSSEKSPATCSTSTSTSTNTNTNTIININSSSSKKNQNQQKSSTQMVTDQD